LKELLHVVFCGKTFVERQKIWNQSVSDLEGEKGIDAKKH
jgi:hypothetical protein